jgi:hypothetical protein
MQILEPGAILPGFQCGLFTRRVKSERRLSTSHALQTCLYFTTHAAHIDFLHLMNSGNSGSVEIGNVAVKVEANIEAGRAVAVIVEAMIIGVMEIILVEEGGWRCKGRIGGCWRYRGRRSGRCAHSIMDRRRRACICRQHG